MRNLRPCACLHLHYETAKPENVGRILYPDFLWHVFTAAPDTFMESGRLRDTSEVILGSSFRPVREILESDLARFQRDLLDRVIGTRPLRK